VQGAERSSDGRPDGRGIGSTERVGEAYLIVAGRCNEGSEV
jgi:hypothetical protein